MKTEPDVHDQGGQELASFLRHLRLGTPQQKGLLTVVPLLNGEEAKLDYVSLNQAMKEGWLIVQEISEEGTVPTLTAENAGDQKVLLLDGEQLSGARQNRVLNTSLLLKERSKVPIPVSCVEAGRWFYKTKHFYNEDIVMAQKARAKKLRAVSQNLAQKLKYMADQQEVWDEVYLLCLKSKVHSETAAMSDAYAKYQQELDSLGETFRCEPQQIGIVVLYRGRVAGCDVVSRPDVYQSVHAKLIKSYAVEILFNQGGESVSPEAALQEARAFFERVASTPTKRYPVEAGLGESVRLMDSCLPGAALVHQGEVVHLTVLNPEAEESPTDVPRRFGRRVLK